MNDPFNKNWSEENTPSPEASGVIAHADITIIFDRSGSMSSMQEAVVEGFNSFVKEMKDTPGDSKWTLIQFDDRDSARGAGEEFPLVSFEQKGEREVPFLTADDYKPRGGTALIDAVCSTIQKVSSRVSGQEDHTKVIMMIVTDGCENQSREFNNRRMREMIGETQGRGWQYIYLGANQDSFAEAGNIGIGGQWLNQTAGGALIAPPMGLSSGYSAVNNFVSTSAGISQAFASGMIGVCATVSGSIRNRNMVQPNVVV